MTNLFFTSEQNYMKRDPSTSSTTMAAPVTSAYGGNLYVTNLSIPHTLGYVPMFRAYYEPFGDGVIWPPMGTRLMGFVFNPRNTVGATGPGLIAWATSTQLNLQLFYFNNTLTGTYPVYWVVYADYAL